ncbi:hypothetical protein bcere0007_29370 [Bacillus mycoides]|nr:hypothetical protein bcere0007_29370 [Bacillus mycoides]
MLILGNTRIVGILFLGAIATRYNKVPIKVGAFSLLYRNYTLIHIWDTLNRKGDGGMTV